MRGKALSLESCTKASRDQVLTRAAGSQQDHSIQRLLQPPVGQRDCSDSQGKPLTSVGTAGKAQRPRPGPSAARRGQCPWLCILPCESRAPASPCPLLRRAEGSPRIPNPGVGPSAWQLPMPRERPALCPAGWQPRGRGLRGRDAGGPGRSHGNAPSIPRSPRQRRAIPHPPCTSRGLAGAAAAQPVNS